MAPDDILGKDGRVDDQIAEDMRMAIPGIKHPDKDDLERHDWVYIVTRYGPKPDMIKRRKARVKDVLRHAAICDHMEGENKTTTTRTIHFGELEVMPPHEQPESAPSRRRLLRAPAPTAPANHVYQNPEPPVPSSPTLSSKPFQELLALAGGKLDDDKTSIAEVTKLLDRAGPKAATPPKPPVVHRETVPEPAPSREPLRAVPKSVRPSPPAEATPSVTQWASEGRTMFEKQLAEYTERIKRADEEMTALKVLKEGLEAQAKAVRDMLALLDKMPSAPPAGKRTA